ncbi:MAG: heme-binding domain-containing protein [Bacteroidales bacterium]|nr:heme-binding domain-containing protein [Bacteroidales bacterium]
MPKNEAVTSNDLVKSGFANNTIGDILKTSCYDCHSQQTVYPWYSHIAPVSWLVAKDVREGREELDFSRWNQYSKREWIGKLNEIMEQVEQNKMPMKNYLVLHPAAKLDSIEKKLLLKWAENSIDSILDL